MGGSVPIKNEVILSTTLLNEIDSLDETAGVLVSGSGCILHDLQTYASDRNYLVPVDLGAKGSCCIGGNVSTNAGGQYFFRYGSLHANVLGLEVVLPNGDILDLLNTNLKDNTGYDLKHLFIGAEGTLGVVTKVALQCARMPRSKNAVFVACSSFENVRKTLMLAKDCLGEILAAFEFMDREVLDIVGKSKRIPVLMESKDGDGSSSMNYPYCILIETHGSDPDHDTAKMETFLEQAMADEGSVVDGALAQDMTQLQDM